MSKLSATQKKAIEWLRGVGTWHAAYRSPFTRGTFEALVSKGLAESKGNGALGSMFSPATMILYRAKPSTTHTEE